ncbi:MAG TPA: NAD/NADP octopine/nopaline dehydrogenase family protein [Bacillota bacterium]
MRVAVLGAGNGGFATAADLALRGHAVRLYELPEFAANLEPVRANGGIQMDVLDSFPRPGGFARLEALTTDMAEAVGGAELVLLTVPAYAHDTYVHRLAPHLAPGQVVVFCPGYLGPWLLWQRLREGGRAEQVILGETESLIYACRKTAPDRVWVRGYKRGLRAAALPAAANDRLIELLRSAYPDVEPAPNVIATTLSNANALIHTPLMLLNAAHIERTGGDFLFYHEGMTPAVGRLIESLDEERLAIGRAWGVRLRTMFEQDYGWYAHQGARGRNIHDTHVTNPIYAWSKAPDNLSHRYVAEDVPYGLVTIESFGRHAAVPTPRISAMIELFNALLGRDFRREGRTLDAVGLGGLSLEDARAALEGREFGLPRPPAGRT